MRADITCIACGFRNRGENSHERSFFKIPDDPKTRKKWLDILEIAEEDVRYRSRVCSAHFSRDQCPGFRLRKGSLPKSKRPIFARTKSQQPQSLGAPVTIYLNPTMIIGELPITTAPIVPMTTTDSTIPTVTPTTSASAKKVPASTSSCSSNPIPLAPKPLILPPGILKKVTFQTPLTPVVSSPTFQIAQPQTRPSSLGSDQIVYLSVKIPKPKTQVGRRKYVPMSSPAILKPLRIKSDELKVHAKINPTEEEDDEQLCDSSLIHQPSSDCNEDVDPLS